MRRPFSIHPLDFAASLASSHIVASSKMRPAARRADRVRHLHLADKDQHARRADRHVRKAGEGASGAASNSSTKMTAAVMLVPAIYRLA